MGTSISRRVWNRQFVKPVAPTRPAQRTTRRSKRMLFPVALLIAALVWGMSDRIGFYVGSWTRRSEAAYRSLLPSQPVVVQPTPELWREARAAAYGDVGVLSSVRSEEPRK